MTEQTPPRRRRKAWLGLAVGVLALIAVPLATGDWRSDEPTADVAEVMCEEFVTDRLTSPGTADFQDAESVGEGNDTWTVSGAVDSENGFGALVRTDYVCTVQSDGADGWTLIDLQHRQR